MGVDSGGSAADHGDRGDDRLLRSTRIRGHAVDVTMLKPGIRRTARKLWVDDLAYAEHCYELRSAANSRAEAEAVARSPCPSLSH
jgi:hypothetical protein